MASSSLFPVMGVQHEHVPLLLPDTAAVQRDLVTGGPTITRLDIALQVVDRLMELPGVEVSEVLYVKDCLQSHPSVLALPCGLVGSAGGDDVADFLVTNYSKRGKDATSRGLARSKTERLSKRSAYQKVGAMADAAVAVVRQHSAWTKRKTLQQLAASSDGQVPPEAETLLSDGFRPWGFDVFNFADVAGAEPLRIAGQYAMEVCGLREELSVDASKLMSFLRGVENTYARKDAVPYHNNLHAVCVTQSVVSFLTTFSLADFFGPLSEFGLVLSALIHDLGHDGKNNAFHVASASDIALTYNDHSVLENYHICAGFRLLMREAGMDVLSCLDAEDRKQIRKEIISAVLSTDMARHMQKVSAIKNLLENLGNDADLWIVEGEDALDILRQWTLHVADISAPTFPTLVADRWASMLKEEFFAQGDTEKSLGLPVSPLCDRDTVKFANSQVGFLQFVIEPTFVQMARLSSKVNDDILVQLRENMSVWKHRKELEERGDVHAVVVSELPGVVEVMETLGKGGFATVYRCRMSQRTEEVAVKVVCLDQDSAELEARLLMHIKHPNMVELIDFMHCGDAGSRSTKRKSVLVLQLCTGGTLAKLVHETAGRDKVTVRMAHRLQAVIDVTAAVAYLHSVSIVHRDVKPTNVLLAFAVEITEHLSIERWPPVKLSDMGVSRFIQVSEYVPMTLGVGTPAYMAPEVFAHQDGEPAYSFPCDVYSIAILLHEVLSGQVPFSTVACLNDPRTALLIIRGLRPPLKALPPSEVTQELEDILGLAWHADTAKRMSAAQLHQGLLAVRAPLDCH